MAKPAISAPPATLKTNSLIIRVCLILIPMALAACQAAAPEQTAPPSPSATATSSPTETPVQTASPNPTATSEPTEAPGFTSDPELHESRADGAFKLDIAEGSSIQNPAWSPGGDAILFTRFRAGYNMEPADLFIIDLDSNTLRTLVSDGSSNVNLPGSTWNARTEQIVFSSSREPHDEIYIIDDGDSTGDETRITLRENLVAYEPSLAPDGQAVVFETHQLDVEDNGIITTYKVDGTNGYQFLTGPGEDCRQPNWSPAGDKILYQKFSGQQWDIWVMDTNGANHQRVTGGPGNKTDASFSPDGQWIVYSSDGDGLEFANLFIIPVSGGSPVRVTHYEGYDGAPSWSPDGKQIAFESYPGDPDDSEGTTLWVIDVPEH